MQEAVHFPKLRTQFAEFLNGGSLERLRILSSPTSVGFGTGASGPCLALFSAAGSAALGLGPIGPCLIGPAALLGSVSQTAFAATSGAGILTCCPSITPFGLTLGPD